MSACSSERYQTVVRLSSLFVLELVVYVGARHVSPAQHVVVPHKLSAVPWHVVVSPSATIES